MASRSPVSLVFKLSSATFVAHGSEFARDSPVDESAAKSATAKAAAVETDLGSRFAAMPGEPTRLFGGTYPRGVGWGGGVYGSLLGTLESISSATDSTF